MKRISRGEAKKYIKKAKSISIGREKQFGHESEVVTANTGKKEMSITSNSGELHKTGVDYGFYGHMKVSATKSAFKSPSIKGGING